MNVEKDILNILAKKGNTANVTPTPVDKNIPYIIENKLQNYIDIIRMSTSDRNRAKSTINILERIYGLAELNMQLLHSVFKEELDKISQEERELLIKKVTSAFDEEEYVFNERGIEVYSVKDQYSEQNGAEYVTDFLELYRNLLNVPMINNIVVTMPNIIDIIVHGEINSAWVDKKDIYPYQNSKLVTQYIHHLEVVRDELRNNPVSYIKNFLDSPIKYTSHVVE